MAKEYIGDGAYAEAMDYGALCLTAENGIAATDSVYVDCEDIPKLLLFIYVNFPSAFKILKGKL